MTLVLGFGNSHYFGMAADRRFTNWDGSGFSDENVKVTSFICLNARLAVGFAGLAKAPGFETAAWLLAALLEAAKPDYEARNTLHRFAERATQDFRKLRVDKRLLRTTFLFTGFLGFDPPRPCYARVSNYEHDRNIVCATASEKFSVLEMLWNRSVNKEPGLIATAGNPAGLNLLRVEELKAMLSHKKPSAAVVEKAVSIIREAADNFRSAGSVGKQISTAVIPSRPGEPILFDYDTAVPTNKVFMVNMAVGLPGQEVSYRDLALEKVGDGPNPPAPMLVPRNSRCFCGSGEKYKRCHGAPPKEPLTR